MGDRLQYPDFSFSQWYCLPVIDTLSFLFSSVLCDGGQRYSFASEGDVLVVKGQMVSVMLLDLQVNEGETSIASLHYRATMPKRLLEQTKFYDLSFWKSIKESEITRFFSDNRIT